MGRLPSSHCLSVACRRKHNVLFRHADHSEISAPAAFLLRRFRRERACPLYQRIRLWPGRVCLGGPPQCERNANIARLWIGKCPCRSPLGLGSSRPRIQCICYNTAWMRSRGLGRMEYLSKFRLWPCTACIGVWHQHAPCQRAPRCTTSRNAYPTGPRTLLPPISSLHLPRCCLAHHEPAL